METLEEQSGDRVGARLEVVEEGLAEVLRLLQMQQKPSKVERTKAYYESQRLLNARVFRRGHPRVQATLEYLFRTSCILVSLIDEVILLILLCIMDVLHPDSRLYMSILFVSIAMQVVHLLFLTIVTIEMVKQLMFRVASIADMLSVYVSIVLLYAGLYTVLAYVDPTCFSGLNAEDFEGPTKALSVFGNFIYFSNVAMASVGFGDIFPSSGVARSIVFTETLMSVGFLCILFGNIEYKDPTEMEDPTPSLDMGMGPDRHGTHVPLLSVGHEDTSM
ncbi:hypothetical protein KIPB_001305 [Kipferlia bialata]|uniref:Potassium channel domain-containing protein n=1 Tax=Kipferlia bialata TaxID=797122 RepID=A0A9K3CQE9_9EUKA|nr:hypothetical protein KIPB_001305 [Kipferlia bialata]|eukprot:g1305.t1